MWKVQIKFLDYIKELCSDQAWCCYHPTIEMLKPWVVLKWLKGIQVCGRNIELSYLRGKKKCSQLLIVPVDNMAIDALLLHQMITESTVTHSQSVSQWNSPSIHFQTTHSCSQTLQPTNQWSNEWPWSGWINSLFSNIIVFVRDKGQVLYIYIYDGQVAAIGQNYLVKKKKKTHIHRLSFHFRKVIKFWRFIFH